MTILGNGCAGLRFGCTGLALRARLQHSPPSHNLRCFGYGYVLLIFLPCVYEPEEPDDDSWKWMRRPTFRVYGPRLAGLQYSPPSHNLGCFGSVFTSFGSQSGQPGSVWICCRARYVFGKGVEQFLVQMQLTRTRTGHGRARVYRCLSLHWSLELLYSELPFLCRLRINGCV